MARPTKSAAREGKTKAAAELVAASAATAPTHDEIARRAYEIWQAKGGGHGHHDEDWYQAERELKLGRQ